MVEFEPRGDSSAPGGTLKSLVTLIARKPHAPRPTSRDFGHFWSDFRPRRWSVSVSVVLRLFGQSKIPAGDAFQNAVLRREIFVLRRSSWFTKPLTYARRPPISCPSSPTHITEEGMFSRCSIFLPHGIGCAGPAEHLSKGVRRVVFIGCRSESLPHKISFLSKPSSSRFLCSAGTGLCLTVTLRNCTGRDQSLESGREAEPRTLSGKFSCFSSRWRKGKRCRL
jgi:hypothetical protein